MNHLKYPARLTIIKGVGFTPREIDVIVSIENGKESANHLTDFLDIGRNVVDHHLRNIAVKIKDSHKLESCLERTLSKQEKVLEFLKDCDLEDKKIRHKHYLELCVCKLFYQKLLVIKNSYEKSPIVYCESHNGITKPLQEILEKAGVSFTHQTTENRPDFVLKITSSSSQPLRTMFTVQIVKNDSLASRESHLKEVKFSDDGSYYQSIFDILAILLSQNVVKQNFLEFERESQLIFSTKKEFWRSIFLLEPRFQRMGMILGISLLCLSYLLFWIHSGDFWKTKTTNHSSLQQQKKISHGIEWNIPRQDNIFIERKDLLEKLHKILHKPVSSPDDVTISACVGLGGVGKTQLALYYLHHPPHSYTLRAWFSAEDKEGLREQFLQFAEFLGFTHQNNVANAPMLYVKSWLAEHPGWLLAFDNVDQYEDIKDFLPTHGGHIIITTRKRQWPSKFQVLPIDVMTEKESIQTIQSIIGSPIKKDKALISLVTTLGYLPLAMVQAAAYIKQNQISIQKYLKLYQQQEMELLSSKAFPEGVKAHPVSITWNISLEAILKECKKNQEEPLAIELITVCSYLSPDKIDKKILESWIRQSHPKISNPYIICGRHIGYLWNYSLINYNDNVISIHRLVQAVLRDHLQKAIIKSRETPLNFDLKWYKMLLRFFIENEHKFKLTNSFHQLLETKERFKSIFTNPRDPSYIELELILAPVYFNQEKYETFYETLKQSHQNLSRLKGFYFLKAKLFYLFSAYFRKYGNFVEAQKSLNQALIYFQKIDSQEKRRNNEVKDLYSTILYNKANLVYAKCKKEGAVVSQETDEALNVIQKAIQHFCETKNQRNWLRSIELYGRLLILQKEGKKVLKVFHSYADTIEKIADDRTKMLFYLTYADAYQLVEKEKKARYFLKEAGKIATRLNLKGELENIKEKLKTSRY